jgi:hypothetical protein
LDLSRFRISGSVLSLAAILATLSRLDVRFERHLDHFSRGEPDARWLPAVGANGWTLLTADKRIRYNILERRALQINSVYEFVFASGNLSGGDMAAALEAAIHKMRRLHRETKPPFVAAITKKGEVHLRWPKAK